MARRSAPPNCRAGGPLGAPVGLCEGLERVRRIELPTRSLGSFCSTTELHPHRRRIAWKLGVFIRGRNGEIGRRVDPPETRGRIAPAATLPANARGRISDEPEADRGYGEGLPPGYATRDRGQGCGGHLPGLDQRRGRLRPDHPGRLAKPAKYARPDANLPGHQRWLANRRAAGRGGGAAFGKG